ncbi:hypothetical protein [Ilumatobacter sp.]|uniref:hypothetical protein n=1 Tax=Ilumatobacter sp. TaxID=1967498 RepID=UPI003C686D4A
MPNFCDSHRLPHANVDPIDDTAARLLISSCLAIPRRPETIVLLLDHARRGVEVVGIVNTRDPDSIYGVAEIVISRAIHMPEVAGAVIGSARPDGGEDLVDVDRWLDIDEELSCTGVELIEWYVIGRSVRLPRLDLGEPARWMP